MTCNWQFQCERFPKQLQASTCHSLDILRIFHISLIDRNSVARSFNSTGILSIVEIRKQAPPSFEFFVDLNTRGISILISVFFEEIHHPVCALQINIHSVRNIFMIMLLEEAISSVAMHAQDFQITAEISSKHSATRQSFTKTI